MRKRKSVAVVGSGISGLSAAWLLSSGHDVTLFEADDRLGGHSNTVDADGTFVDTGFIVFNPQSYPNLVSLFAHLDVPVHDAPMSFSVSLEGGRSEYSGDNLGTLIGHPRNLLDRQHWRMMLDLVRFFRLAPEWAKSLTDETTELSTFLKLNGFSEAFLDRHILPMAAAIWSTPSARVMSFPAASFFRFFANHGLLQPRNQPQWKTVTGGSRTYVQRLASGIKGTVRVGSAVETISRLPFGVEVRSGGVKSRFDACVLATHADQALALLSDPSAQERRLLGAFAYQANRAVLHRDRSVMPRRRRLWSSWNYLAGPAIDGARALSVTYWMSKLQGLPDPDLFVTLNPARDIPEERVLGVYDYAHPVFDGPAMEAQTKLWSLQGQRNTWFCGSYFGYGFHEDGLQSGLAVAEQLGGLARPWSVEGQSSRIHVRPLVPMAEVA